jgi:hypothetical protein
MAIVLALKVDKTKPIRRGSAYYWKVVRDLTAADRDRLFTIEDVLGQTNSVDKATVRQWLTNLVDAGIAARQDPARPGAPVLFRLVQRPSVLPHLARGGRVVASGQEAMWNAMRALRSFTALELAVSASTEERPVTLETAKSYVHRLQAAGYLTVEREAVSGRGARLAVVRLKKTMNRGPLAPRILRTKLVYDPNIDEVVGEAEAEELA